MSALYCMFLILNCVFVQGEFVIRKKCKDVNTSLCYVHNVMVEPCGGGPIFCSLKKFKPYDLVLDVTPRFTSDKLQVIINGDVDNQNTYSTPFTRPGEQTETLDGTTLEMGQRTHLNVLLNVDKRATGKFPIQIKISDEEDSSKVCCAIITVKIK